jgi:hypothetical protein
VGRAFSSHQQILVVRAVLILVFIKFNAIPEAEKFDGFLSVSEGISGLISKRDLEFSRDFTPTPPSTLSSGVSAVPQSHRNPGKYA